MSVSFYSNIVQIPRLASIGQAVRRPVTNQTFSLNDIEALFSEVREVFYICMERITVLSNDYDFSFIPYHALRASRGNCNKAVKRQFGRILSN